MEAIKGIYEEVKTALSGLFSFVSVQLANISVTDIFDILLMAVMLTWLYRFVRGRRAAKLLTGIVVWIIILSIGRLFNMHTISFLLGYIFQAGIIAVVILFQPELRDALERVGEEPLRGFKGFGESRGLTETKAWIRDVTEAVSDMSRSRTGALIVFEETAQLNDIVRSGIETDAKISPYLLRNIFFNKSPLHDGAVVIRNGRILAAGCLLPLTRRSDIDPDLGTRHRAAIGMSEVSDAVVVVVSEETGKISVAQKGYIKRDYTAQMLQDLLSERFVSDKNKETPVFAEIVDEKSGDVQQAFREKLGENGETGEKKEENA